MYELDPDLNLSEVFVDRGKAKSDGYDQRGTVRVVQKPVYSNQVGSVTQDSSMTVASCANRRPQSDLTGRQIAHLTNEAYGIEATGDNAEVQASSSNPDPTNGTLLEDSPGDGHGSVLNEWEYSEDDIFKPFDDDVYPDPSLDLNCNKSKNNGFADHSDVDVFEFADSEKEVIGQTGPQKLKKDGPKVKPFKETEAEFQRSRAATMVPDRMELPDSPFKGLLATRGKRQQSEPVETSTKGIEASRDHTSFKSGENDLSHSPFHVEIPVKGVIKAHPPDDNSDDIIVSPRGQENWKPDADCYLVSGALLPEETPGTQENRRRSSEAQKTKKSCPKNHTFSSSRTSQDKNIGTKTNEKPMPPPRFGSSFNYPSGFTPQKINEIRDRSTRATELEAAKKDGAKEDHLKQIETVHDCAVNYHNAVEAGRSDKKIEKLRAQWERENNILKEKVAETDKTKAEYRTQEEERKKAAKTPQASSQPRTRTGQSAKRIDQTTPATPPSKPGAPPRSILKPASSAQKKSDAPKKQETVKKAESTKRRAKNMTSSSNSGPPSISRIRSCAVNVSSSENENNDGGNSPDVSIISARPRKRLRRTK